MYSRLLVSFATLCVVMCAFGHAVLVPQGNGGHTLQREKVSRFEYSIALLDFPLVRKDLKISNAEAVKILATLRATTSKPPEPGVHNLVGKEADKHFAQINKDFVDAAAMLTSSQLRRLRQISFQVRGLEAAVGTLAKKWGITNKEMVAIDKFRLNETNKNSATFKDLESAKKGVPQNFAVECRLRMNRGILKILTPTQRKMWAGEIGKPFDIASVLNPKA